MNTTMSQSAASLEFLSDQVKSGVHLYYERQRRGYHLRWIGAKQVFEVRQGYSGSFGDIREFTDFTEAYDWLKNGTPIKVVKS